MLDIGGNFSSLLASNGQFGNFLDGLNPNGTAVQLGEFVETLTSNLEANVIRSPQVVLQSSDNSQRFLGVQSEEDSGCWGGGGGRNGWPDLAIYTPVQESRCLNQKLLHLLSKLQKSVCGKDLVKLL